MIRRSPPHRLLAPAAGGAQAAADSGYDLATLRELVADQIAVAGTGALDALPPQARIVDTTLRPGTVAAGTIAPLRVAVSSPASTPAPTSTPPAPAAPTLEPEP